MKYLLPLLLATLFASCSSKTERLFEAKDFVPDSVFTTGIEGPAFLNGQLYAVNYREEGTIGKVDDHGNVTMFIELPEGSIGNGIRFDLDEQMFVADYAGHNILKIIPETKELSVLVHEPDMNQPNDLAIMDNGILFASDPDWKNNKGQIWRITPEGEVTLLEKNMGTTNGIEVSPDQKTLYVNESAQRKIWKYDLDEKGNISNKTLFYEFEDAGLDGMRCDETGQLYVARYDAGSVAILTPNGKLAFEVKLKGKKPTNVAFGGNDGRSIFVTMQDRGAIETFRAEHKGRGFQD